MYWHWVGLHGFFIHIVLIWFNFEKKNDFLPALLDGLINQNYINCVLMNNWFPLKAKANIFFKSISTPSRQSWHLPPFERHSCGKQQTMKWTDLLRSKIEAEIYMHRINNSRLPLPLNHILRTHRVINETMQAM